MDSLDFEIEFANIDLSTNSMGDSLDLLAPLFGYSTGKDVLVQVSTVVNELIDTVFGITNHKLHISFAGTDISSLLNITAAKALFEMIQINGITPEAFLNDIIDNFINAVF